MRVLSLGFPLPGAPVDNHTFASAPTFFDYDALVVDPSALARLMDEIASEAAEHRTRDGLRVVARTGGRDTVGLADLMRDRRDETSRLLGRGGLVVVIAQAHGSYGWLPAPDGLTYDEPLLRRGSGDQMSVSLDAHAFAPFIERQRGRLAYRVYFDESVPGFAGEVFARSAGGAAVGIELTVDGGRVVFIPPPARPPSESERYAFAAALLESIRQALRIEARGAAPAWLGEYTLPGLAERMSTRDEAQQRLAGARGALKDAETGVDELDGYRRLLWQEGRHGLEEAARAALALIGFRVTPEDLDQAARLRDGGGAGAQTVLLEVDGGEEAAGLDGHYRLRKRLEEAIAKGTAARGLLVINGYRRTAPSERGVQYEDALRVAAERMRYCVATAEQLFHAVRAALEGDEATVAAFRERLLTTEGVLRED